MSEPKPAKTFAAIGPGGHVIFTFAAANSQEARATVASYRKRSDTIEAVRRYTDDMRTWGRTNATRDYP